MAQLLYISNHKENGNPEPRRILEITPPPKINIWFFGLEKKIYVVHAFSAISSQCTTYTLFTLSTSLPPWISNIYVKWKINGSIVIVIYSWYKEHYLNFCHIDSMQFYKWTCLDSYSLIVIYGYNYNSAVYFSSENSRQARHACQ